MNKLVQFVLIAPLLCCGLFDIASSAAFIDLPDTINVNEVGPPMEICVNLTLPEDRTVVLNTVFQQADTVSAADFLPIINEELAFSANGVTRKCVDLDVYEDNVVENTERLQIQLSDSLSSSTSSINVNILDNSRVSVSFTKKTFESENEQGAVSVCAHLVGGTIERSVSFTFMENTTARTASPIDDYFPVSLTMRSFTPEKAMEEECVHVTIFPDNLIEEDEYVFMNLLSNGDAVDIVQSTARVIIKDANGVDLALADSAVSVSEGNSGLTIVSVEVVLSWPVGHTLMRDIAVLATTSDGTATVANRDYEMLSNATLLMFPSTASNGQRLNAVIHVMGDLILEPDEHFFVTFRGQREIDDFEGNSDVLVTINNDGDVIRDCGDLEAPADGTVSVDANTEQDSIASYSCSLGYTLSGPTHRTCSSSNGLWTENAPVCNIVNCGDPPEPANGRVTIQSTDYLGTASYMCESGFELRSGSMTETRTCLVDGRWSGMDPACDRVNCGNLPSVENGMISYGTGGTLYESQATYVCNSGYETDGPNTRMCMASGEWSNSAATCEPVNCGGLSGPDDGSVDVPVTTYLEVATYSCNANFKIVNGPMTRVCQADGMWSSVAPSCQVIECPALSNPVNGMVIIDVAANGDTSAVYECDVGYSLQGSSVRDCQQDSQWSETAPTCQIVQCPVLINPANGAVDSPSNVYMTVSNYSCNLGYNLMGAAATSCQPNGVWSEPPPACIVVTCSGLSSPANGAIHVDLTTFESIATYSCNGGFRIVGPETRSCQADGAWSGQPPTCEEIQCLELMLVNGSVTLSNGNRINSMATFSCDGGLYLIGLESLTCMSDGIWSDIIPTCEVVSCPELSIDNGNVVLSNGTRPGSVATPTCDEGLLLDGPSSHTCLANGQWSETEDNTCISHPTTGRVSDLPQPTIIGIVMGCILAVIITTVIVTVIIIILCVIRRKKIYKKYVLPYRSYIYANGMRNHNSSMINAEIQEWETNSRQHAVDAVDALDAVDTPEKPQLL